MNNRVRFITRTAVLIALLLVLQFVTKPLGQLVTGSSVNFILIASVMISGVWSGVIVAAVSPFFAFLLGIGTPMLPIVPMIAIGNIVIVLIYYVVFRIIKSKNPLNPTAWIMAIVVGSVVKYLTLYLLVVRFTIPVLNLPDKAAKTLSVAFGTTQLVTALIGGAIAFIAVPLIKKAINRQ